MKIYEKLNYLLTLLYKKNQLEVYFFFLETAIFVYWLGIIWILFSLWNAVDLRLDLHFSEMLAININLKSYLYLAVCVLIETEEKRETSEFV